MKISHLLFAVVVGMPVLPVTATECGVNNTSLTAPFAGQWRSKDGELYDIAPGKLNHTFTVHLVTGDETQHSSAHFVAVYDGEEPDQSALDCRDLTAEERESIERKMIHLSNAITIPKSDADRQNRQEIALFRAKLSHPPYPMMAATHYEDRQWLILLGPTRLMDVWYGEGQFSVQVYERVSAKASP